MKKKLIRSMLLLVILAATLTAAFVMPRLYDSMKRRAFSELRDIAVTVTCAMDAGEEDAALLPALQAALPHLRISWIAPDGSVRYDSGVPDITKLDSHSMRNEVLEAMAEGEGQDSRLSASLGENTYYYARQLADGSILRMAMAQRSIFGEVMGLLPSLLLIVLLVIGILLVLSDRLTASLLKPLNTLNLDHPEENEAYEELSPLLAKIAQQNKRIDAQLKDSLESGQKAAAITDNMAEGLMMLAPDGRVLSMNQSAQRLLDGEGNAYAGQHYMALCRDLSMHDTIEQALKGVPASGTVSRHGGIYLLHANPVWVSDELVGAVALLLDITADAQAETARREFSANVSHELKTPLTIIAGYAEMMKTGLAGPEDTQALAVKIYDEAGHLLSLIEDIIALSRLDERTEAAVEEPVNLYVLAQDVCDRFRPVAQARQVTLLLEGEPCYVSGQPALLEEMVRNLVDNAIRYNVQGGSVTIKVYRQNGYPSFEVADTGIGIAPAHHARIFERFYRVDKSRSRETGGTGLGLSIVKHGAQIHGAQVSLESEEGAGTRITIVFSA